MPNVVTVLKAEISRLAKKEAKAATTKLLRASTQHRSDIAKLRRLVDQQAKEIAVLRKHAEKKASGEAMPEAKEAVRFSARSVKAQRARLGLSALDYGKLVGVSALTIYSWEAGKSRPRAAQFQSLLAVRGIGKREAVERLEQLAAKQ